MFLGALLRGGPEPSSLEAAAKPAPYDERLCSDIIEMAGIPRGICTVLGCDGAKLGLEIARSGGFLVHILDPQSSAVEAVRRLPETEQLHGKSLIVEKGSFRQLPYADNTIDLVVATHLTKETLNDLSLSEIVRVLRPHGKVVLGSSTDRERSKEALTPQELTRWIAKDASAKSEIRKDDFGTWAVITKPALAGVDNWSHWEHGPDNNPVSTDAVIKAPYMTQWFGLPYYIAMPAITTSAGGRVFVAMGHIAHHEREEPWLNTLLARSGYNGTELWTRKLPDGYLVHRSAFIATDDTFYMIDMTGNGCLMLDPETGEEKGRVRVPQVRGEWKWIALQDGVLYALAGEQKDRPETTIVRSTLTHWSWLELSKGYYDQRIPWGFGTTILAYDLTAGKVLWTHTENGALDSRAMVIGDGNVYFYGPDSHIGCLDAKSGNLLWTNDEPKVRELIEEPGRALGSTPGFRTTCFCLYTPKALFYEAQTKMNVVAVSTKNGTLLWHRRKTTNNPNMIYVDDHLLVGIGPEGSTLVLDPMTGTTIEDLGFKKQSCVRLTATPDSFFCRGWPEGLTRYDRISKKVLFNGAIRPACNDGVIAANGLLYLGPWLCDCNLSLMGTVAMCSAGNSPIERQVTEVERLEVAHADVSRVAPLEVSADDWATYRGNNAHNAASAASVSDRASKVWVFQPQTAYVPTAATAAGGLIFLSGNDGKVRAIDAVSGTQKWSFMTAGPIMQPPTIWNGRAYIGSGDGYVYALEAASGHLLWRFRAAPCERRIMVYGSLCSTWPVNSGVLVQDGVAYVAAGIADYDGTYVYALDAVTGAIKWQNNSSGHLDKVLRKGVSAQGNLTIADGRLWMPGGNVISPAAYDLKTGGYVGDPPGDGSPKSNRGEEIGVFKEHYLVFGGRLRYSATENVVDPGSFVLAARKPDGTGFNPTPFAQGMIPPAWDGQKLVFVSGQKTAPLCWRGDIIEDFLANRNPNREALKLWEATALKESDTVALALAKNAVLAVSESPKPRQSESRWTVCSLNRENGSVIWQHELPSAALPGGITVDRDGRVIVIMQNGSVACFGGADAIRAYSTAITGMANEGTNGKQKAIEALKDVARTAQNAEALDGVIANLEKLGVEFGRAAREAGYITRWKLLAPVPTVEGTSVGEPDVDFTKSYAIGDRTLVWREYATDSPTGVVDLVGIYGPRGDAVAYGYGEVNLPKAQEIQLKIGSNFGAKCWVNGTEIGSFDALRFYQPDQNTLKATGKQGVNKILVRISQMNPISAFSVRLTDSEGKPINLTR